MVLFELPQSSTVEKKCETFVPPEVKSNESEAEEFETKVTSIPPECATPNVRPRRNAALMGELLRRFRS